MGYLYLFSVGAALDKAVSFVSAFQKCIIIIIIIIIIMFFCCLIIFYCFSHANLNIYRTDLHEICRISRPLVVDIIFFGPSRDVVVTTNFVGKIDSIPQVVVRMTFARAAPPA